MKSLIVPFLCLVSLASDAADDCTFDPRHQANVITSIAARFPGGTANVRDRLVTWTNHAEGTTTFAYGGCYDLGSEVSRATRLAAPRTLSQVFALARELATKFWSNDIVSARRATKTLLAGLSKSKYTIEKINGAELFSVSDPGYVELYVEHEYKDGIDRVAIAWQGNF